MPRVHTSITYRGCNKILTTQSVVKQHAFLFISISVVPVFLLPTQVTTLVIQALISIMFNKRKSTYFLTKRKYNVTRRIYLCLLPLPLSAPYSITSPPVSCLPIFIISSKKISKNVLTLSRPLESQFWVATHRFITTGYNTNISLSPSLSLALSLSLSHITRPDGSTHIIPKTNIYTILRQPHPLPNSKIYSNNAGDIIILHPVRFSSSRLQVVYQLKLFVLFSLLIPLDILLPQTNLTGVGQLFD